MKKIILFILLVISIAPVYAQTSVGVIGGYNLSFVYPDINWTPSNYKVSYGTGWRTGFVADQHLWKDFYLQPQLIFNQKSYNYSTIANVNDAHYKYKRHLLYLELQAHLLYKPKIGNGRLFLGAGPYIGRGISGRERVEGYDQDGRFSSLGYDIIKYKKPPPFNRDYDEENVTYMKPYDVGINLLAGYELKNGLFFNVIYSLGTNNTSYDATRSYNGYLGLTVGYFLKKFI
ncbi:outer membrane beta-barrel protein [Chitinophaga ginsengisoli]|uniref:Outer membrane protein with beta-barrel domain n=1 Tax=Chitinophaga ginsengisoli TaxID=363837 RepID=A0A2P8GAB0_9BACT|nr:outer membrane beta-barrel protein [Chitinophaga ginsengisoli]PSL30911.1 outer membrane protein with beta-barrel domain [Chitinophaga ginsengisoli]